jgi:excisionase family DNA binding protein
MSSSISKHIDQLPEILTAQHIADYLTISRRRVYELFQMTVEAGGIRSFDIGNSKRVEKEDFICWIGEQKKRKERRV